MISRVGLIYFPDQQKALRGMHSKLRDGGKVSAMVYSTAECNSFFSIPVLIIRQRAQLPTPLPGQPGPFSLGQPVVLKKALADRDVRIEKINAPVRVATATECLQFEQESFGALHQMLGGLSDREKDEAWEEIEQAIQQFENDQHFEGPCEMLIAVGTK